MLFQLYVVAERKLHSYLLVLVFRWTVVPTTVPDFVRPSKFLLSARSCRLHGTPRGRHSGTTNGSALCTLLSVVTARLQPGVAPINIYLTTGFDCIWSWGVTLMRGNCSSFWHVGVPGFLNSFVTVLSRWAWSISMRSRGLRSFPFCMGPECGCDF